MKNGIALSVLYVLVIIALILYILAMTGHHITIG